MTEDEAQKMAQFRYRIICSLIPESLETLKERIERLALNEWQLPNGQLRSYSAATIEDWFYDYKKFGHEALLKPSRKDKSTHRSISTKLAEQIDFLLKEYEGMKNSNIIRHLKDSGYLPDNKPSTATLYRYLTRVRPVKKTPKGQLRRAFESSAPGVLYQTDLMYGPELKIKGKDGRLRNKKTYLIAIIDDYSRRICAAEFFTDQGLMNYLKVLENALRSCGIPQKIYCDNGQIFISSQVTRIGMVLGMKVVRTKVRDAAAKGKIERFFRTVRDQFLDGTLRIMKGAKDLEQLNAVFRTFVATYNHSKHSAFGDSPQGRWTKSDNQPKFPDDNIDINTLFLLEETRVVKKDGTVSLQNTLFEIYSSLAKQKVNVRFNPHDLSRIYAWDGQQYLGAFYPLDRQANDGIPRNPPKDNESGE